MTQRDLTKINIVIINLIKVLLIVEIQQISYKLNISSIDWIINAIVLLLYVHILCRFFKQFVSH